MGGAGADVVDQPRRRRGMSYGTRGAGRRKVTGEEDPNVIPRTAPLGFLGRLPFKIVGSLRYKPSAANLREHPGGAGLSSHGYRADGAGRGGGEEHEPLLGGAGDEEDLRRWQQRRGSSSSPPPPPSQSNRARSDTTASGDTSSSYRSRGDLFPSDGEGEEDAVPLDDEFTVALERVDDRSSNKTRSSKGKRPADADRGLSRTISRTTMSSANTPIDALSGSQVSSPTGAGHDEALTPSLEDLRREEEQAEREEHEEIERKRRAASQLALQRGLSKADDVGAAGAMHEAKAEPGDREPPYARAEEPLLGPNTPTSGDKEAEEVKEAKPPPPPPPLTSPEAVGEQTKGGGGGEEGRFVPARLPHFG